MGKAQGGFEYARQCAAGRTLLLGCTGVELHLGELQIPVAVLVPYEFVDGARGLVEAVGIESRMNLGDSLLQTRGNPAVGVGERHRLAGILPAVVPFEVHQRETGRIPQLVAEVAVAFGALQVELDVATVGSEAGEREAQRIGAECRDAFRKFLAGALLDARRFPGVHQS